MSELPFQNDTYTTPPGRERLAHRILLRCRIYYVLKFSQIVLRYWKEAKSGKFDMELWSTAATDVFNVIEQCGGRFHIAGLENLRTTDGPVVFIANHMSTMETLIPPAFIYPHKKPVYVIKEQLLDVPFFGEYLSDCITVTRRSPTEDFKQVMSKGTDMLNQGRSVFVFPQATRTPDLDPSKFNTLGVKLARKAGVPVIPLALKTDFWGTGKLVKDFGPLDPAKTIYFEFGSPLAVNGSGKQEHEQIVNFITSRLARWRAQDAR